MRLKKEYDVFIAYHGSYEDGGSREGSDIVYKYLSERGLKCFYFPYSGKDTYKSTILDVMKSKVFLLVCTQNIHTLENGRIDQKYHYELSTEIDAFYALTQIGEMSNKDAKIVVFDKCRRGFEAKLHELFANRTHFYAEYNNNILEELFQWVMIGVGSFSTWQDTQITSEIKEVFAIRASMKEACSFDTLIATSKHIRAIGISNTEMTTRINPEAIRNCIKKGGTVELIFLDPEGEFTKQREAEEELRPGKIRNITNVNIDCAIDIRNDLQDKKDQFRLMKYDKQPRMNLIFADDFLFLQYYANNIPGLKNPSFFIEKQLVSPVFDFCNSVYEYIRANAEEIIV